MCVIVCVWLCEFMNVCVYELCVYLLAPRPWGRFLWVLPPGPVPAPLLVLEPPTGSLWGDGMVVSGWYHLFSFQKHLN